MSKSINELNSDLFGSEEDERFSSPLEARKKAMDFLARREYGRNELIGKLESRGFLHGVATEAVDRLTGQGLQNDERFVENFVQSRIRQGKGPRRIGQELSQRGLKAGLVDQVLSAVDTDWLELASDVRSRKFGDQVPGEFEEKARQMRFLQYRGFDSEQIRFAVAGDRS
jgi:regulatory protein